MSNESEASLLERVNRGLGQLRAEYESDDDLSQRFAQPLYFDQLQGITPSFLVGGRGTGKTTTLRSMSFGGQARLSGSLDPDHWRVIGAYWKVEPNVVSVFKGKGVTEEVWSDVFSHYLNLKLCSLVVEYANWLNKIGVETTLDAHNSELFTRSLNLQAGKSVRELGNQIDVALVDIESKINGNISALEKSHLSVLGRPLDYLFDAVSGLKASLRNPFMFCLDEYENLTAYQQKLLNTLIKQVGSAPYTFKIGVRNTLAIDRTTLVDQQPLQEPADFRTVDIVSHLKDESFEAFAANVLKQRLSMVDLDSREPSWLLPALSLEEEAQLLGSQVVRAKLMRTINSSAGVTALDIDFLNELPDLEASLIARWAEAHGESELSVLRFARESPTKWDARVVNYGYAMLFTIRENRVGERKYYAGWRTYCQLADGNIRYLIRLVYEALRLHVTGGHQLQRQVSTLDQTRAAARVGETTIRDLQGWSRQGAALTRLALGLGSIFGSLARERALNTPEVVQFRVNYTGSHAQPASVDELLYEAVGQGILIAFDGDKNPRFSGATRERDYQLHPVLAPYFVYSFRSKRRMTIKADDIISLTSREYAVAAIRRVLRSRRISSEDLPNQLQQTLFDGI